MDIGLIFNQVAELYKHLWTVGFVFYGMTFTYGQIVTYGLFVVVVVCWIRNMRD